MSTESLPTNRELLDSVDAATKLYSILVLIEDLMEDSEFIDQLEGEDQGFLDTVWDFFDRLEQKFNPDEEQEVEDPILWQQQQDEETD